MNFETIVNHEEAEWVVFLHGAGGSIKTWSAQVPDFKRTYNLLLIDLRDHGHSKNIAPAYDTYNFQIIADDIIAVIDRLAIERAHFVTLSFGSVLMQSLYLNTSFEVRSVIMAGGIFKGNILIKTFVHLARLMNNFFNYQQMYSMFSYLLMPRKRNQKARRVYQHQSKKLTEKEYMKWIGLYEEFFRLLSDFFYFPIKIPALIVMGEKDFVFMKGAKDYARHQKLVEIAVIPDTGHICTIESPTEFNTIALDFLATQSSQE